MLAQRPAAKQAPAVYAIIPAYGRPELLAAALASLAGQGPALRGAIVVNNSRDDVTARVAREGPLAVTLLTPPCNLGTAGGIAWGLASWRARADATHAWIMDDDATAAPGALTAMLEAMESTAADAAAPLLLGDAGTIKWLPFPCAERGAERMGLTPAEFCARYGTAPRPWGWAMWASLVLTRRAVETLDPPRLDLWSQFTDIEYTLRLTERFRGVLAPRAVCHHLPPAPTPGPGQDLKLYAALQNGNYLATRFRHGWRALRHMPGLHYRYLREYRWRPRAWRDAFTAFFRGAILGLPSGRTVQATDYERARAVWPVPLP